MPAALRKSAGYMALLLSGVAGLVWLWLLVMPPVYDLSYKTIHDETITLQSGRTFVPLAGDCVEVHWAIDRVNALIADGMKSVHYRACIRETFFPLFHFLENEPKLYYHTFIFSIFTQSTEVLVLSTIIGLLVWFSGQMGVLRVRLAARVWRWSGVGVCLVAAVLTGNYLLRAAYPVLGVDENRDGAVIRLQVEPTGWFTPDGCVQVSWQVEHIEAMYVNDEGVIGADARLICTEGMHRIHFKINTQQRSTVYYVFSAPLWDTEEVRLTVAVWLGLLTVAVWLTGIRLWRWLTIVMLSGVLVAGVLGLVYRPVNGMKLVGETLPLPVGSMALILLSTFLLLRVGQSAGHGRFQAHYQRLVSWLNWQNLRRAFRENQADAATAQENDRSTRWKVLAVGVGLAVVIVLGTVSRTYYADAFGLRILWNPYLLARDELLSGTYRSLIYPPGYPGWLALNTLLNVPLEQTAVYQAYLDMLSVLPLYYVLRTIRLNRWLALTGCLAYALYPPLAWSPSAVMGEAFSAASLVWLLAVLIRAAHIPAWWRWLVAGLLTGLLVVIRPDTLVFIISGGLWLLVQGYPFRRLVGYGGAMLVGFAVLPGIWGLYNVSLHGRFVFTSNSGANSLWSGISQVPNPYYYLYSAGTSRTYWTGMEKQGYDTTRWHEDYTLWSFEAVADFSHSYLRAVREHPEIVLQPIIYRWRTMLFFPDSLYLLQNPDLRYRWEQQLWGREAALPVLHFVERYGVLFWMGGLLLARRSRGLLLVLLLPMGSALVGLGLVYYEARYVQYAYLSYLLSMVVCCGYAVTLLRRMRPVKAP